MKLHWIALFFALTITSLAKANPDEITFRIEDGYQTALMFVRGDSSGIAASLYNRMLYVNPIDDGVGLTKTWRERLFQWSCTARHSGDYSCSAKFYETHPGTTIDAGSRSMVFESSEEFAQLFVRDNSGFGLGTGDYHFHVFCHRSKFSLEIAE